MNDTGLNDQLAAWDRDCLLHPTTHTASHARGDVPGRIITGGQGVYIDDRDGNRLLDGFSALYCVNAGYGRTEIADAIADQAHKLAYFHSYAGHGNEPAITLAKMIMDRAPNHMARVYFGLSGSDANETNVKLAWHYNVLRGVGLLAAVELMDDPVAGVWGAPMTTAPAVTAAMLKRGVIARPMPECNAIGIAPPLCVTRDEVDILVDALRAALYDVLPQ